MKPKLNVIVLLENILNAINVKMKIIDVFKKIIYSEGVTPLPAKPMCVLFTLMVGIFILFNNAIHTIP